MNPKSFRFVSGTPLPGLFIHSRALATSKVVAELRPSRRVVAPALECAVHLGLLEIRQVDEVVSNIRAANSYRLTYVPEKGKRAPTDEWASISDEVALAAAEHFRSSQKKSGGQFPFLHAPSSLSCNQKTASSSLSCKSPVPLREHTLISGGKPPEAGAAGSISAVHPQSEDGRSSDAGHCRPPTVRLSVAERQIERIGTAVGLTGYVASKNAQPVKIQVPQFEAPEFSTPERIVLRWLQSFASSCGETPTHRKAQQNLSGQLKGDEIIGAAQSLANTGMIRIGEKGRSRVYILLDAGRDPRLVHEDDGQVDLVDWLEGAPA